MNRKSKRKKEKRKSFLAEKRMWPAHENKKKDGTEKKK